MKEYIFFRKNHFYTIQLEADRPGKTDDEFAYENALSNPGTIKVKDIFGKEIFPKKQLIN